MEKTFTFRLISAWILVSFLTTAVIPSGAYAQALNLPAPGTMVSLTPAYMPILMKGVRVHPENPLLVDFILDSGKSSLKTESPEFKAEAQKLIKYFLASLTIKEEDLWVNLSPYEKDRMITDELGKTELGRDMLAQDYILKQLTASLIYPEKDLGKAFWDRVYTKAREQFGNTDIPVDTFNKVWITADKAKVLERNNVAYVVGAHLKVMLESDYMAAAQANGARTGGSVTRPLDNAQELTKQIIREVVIPEIEKEVNEGQNFAMLRQMFYSMILASWYKLALKDALLNQVYSNQAKTSGVLSDDPAVKDKIYTQYLEAYKKGVFNYIKEDMDAVSQQPVPRKYFSGGLEIGVPKILETVGNPSFTESAQITSAHLNDVTARLAQIVERPDKREQFLQKKGIFNRKHLVSMPEFLALNIPKGAKINIHLKPETAIQPGTGADAEGVIKNVTFLGVLNDGRLSYHRPGVLRVEHLNSDHISKIAIDAAQGNESVDAAEETPAVSVNAHLLSAVAVARVIDALMKDFVVVNVEASRDNLNRPVRDFETPVQ